MKQITANYLFDLSEKDLQMICTTLSVVISDMRENYDSLNHELETNKFDQEQMLEKAEQSISIKAKLIPLIDIYNSFGKPIGAKMNMSFLVRKEKTNEKPAEIAERNRL